MTNSLTLCKFSLPTFRHFPKKKNSQKRKWKCVRFFTSKEASVGTRDVWSFGRWCTRSMGSIWWVSASKMQICNWLEASEGRSQVAHGGILIVCCLPLGVLYQILAQSHCKSPLAPPRSTMVIRNYRLRFVCVWVCERMREKESWNFCLNYWDLISYCGVARYRVWKIRKCKNSKKIKWGFKKKKNHFLYFFPFN